MGNKIVVGPFNHGFRDDRTAFVIDNDSFPTLVNAYQWRGRVKRKRGTALVGRLRRYFDSTSTAYNSGATTITLDGTGAGNLFTGFSLQSTAAIAPGTVTITAPGPTTYTDPSKNGTLSPSGSINYATGAITIAAQAGQAVSVTMSYYPCLPVMGLRDFDTTTQFLTSTLAFDTTYAYTIASTQNSVTEENPFNIWDVSFYKNQPTATYTDYVQKTTASPVNWNLNNYQLSWTVNYQGAIWSTPGMSFPFSSTNIGMQYKKITNVTASGVPLINRVNITIVAHGLTIGDFLYINEVQGITGINFHTGFVTQVVSPNIVEVTFPNATIAAAYTSGGIAQYLTRSADTTVDCIRWYDGDPTNGNVTTPVLNGAKGWVNFCPPLSTTDFSIADLPASTYYLVGARLIFPFKDRLLFLGPVVQNSAGTKAYLKDTIVYSQNGTPYYTTSFTATDFLAANTVFTSILVPQNQTATAGAFIENASGFGGYITAGLDQAFNTVSSNEDVLIAGMDKSQVRIVYSGNDIVPFNMFFINSELGSSSPLSAVNFDKGVIAVGTRGYTITSQTSCERVDLEIPNNAFQIDTTENALQRVCAERDFANEWMYFSYPYIGDQYVFPTRTLQYNYRDSSWALFYETYTCYGTFYVSGGLTWATVGDYYPTWTTWNKPWSTFMPLIGQEIVVAGNPQGFVVQRIHTTSEAKTHYIKSISGATVTSPNHCLNEGDYIVISDCLGTVSAGVNNRIFSVSTPSTNSFLLDPAPPSGTYLGSGKIKRLYVPFVQTKQFPVAWQDGRKTRIGAQQYLFSTTANSQIQLQIYLSQNASYPYNIQTLPPAAGVDTGLIYSSILYTCPESTNLGLTPANTNLQLPNASSQAQIWHRMNTSLIGDTVQIGFTLSDSQMRSFTSGGQTATITGATQASSCVLTAKNSYAVGQTVKISGVLGMTDLNYDSAKQNTYTVIARSPTTITLDVNSTAFSAYVSGGTVVNSSPIYQTAEIECHGFILDVSPSMMLV